MVQYPNDSPIIIYFKSSPWYWIHCFCIRRPWISTCSFFSQPFTKKKKKKKKIKTKTKHQIKQGFQTVSCNYPIRRQWTYSSIGVTSVRAKRADLIFSLKKKEACFLNSWKEGEPMLVLLLFLLRIDMAFGIWRSNQKWQAQHT